MAGGQKLISCLHPCSTSNVALNTRTYAHGPLMGHPSWAGCDIHPPQRTRRLVGPTHPSSADPYAMLGKCYMSLQRQFDKPSRRGPHMSDSSSSSPSTPATLEEMADWGRQAGQAVGMVVGRLRALAAEAVTGPCRGGGVARRRWAVRVLAAGGSGGGGKEGGRRDGGRWPARWRSVMEAGASTGEEARGGRRETADLLACGGRRLPDPAAPVAGDGGGRRRRGHVDAVERDGGEGDGGRGEDKGAAGSRADVLLGLQ
jgi:hypothetical protein